MVIQFPSFLIAAVLCTSVPMASSLSGQEGPNGPQHNGPQHNGPQHNGPQHNGPQHNGPQHNGPQHNGPQHNGPQHNGPQRVGGRRGIHRFGSKGPGFMTGGMPSSKSGKRGSGHRAFGNRGMQHRGMQHRGMQHRGMQHRESQSRGMKSGGKPNFRPSRFQHGRAGMGMSRGFNRSQGVRRSSGMQHRGMMPFGMGHSGSAPKMPRRGNGPDGIGRHRRGRPSSFGRPGTQRFGSKSDNGRGVQSSGNHSRGADRSSNRGVGGWNRPVDHDQRMEQMKQFFAGQFGNRRSDGPGRGLRGKEDSDNKSDRNNRSNMRPDFPQRGPAMERNFGPPRISNRGGGSSDNRGFDRRNIKSDRSSVRPSRSDARANRDKGGAPERKAAEKNRKVEVEINGDTGTLTLKGSAEDVRRFQQLLDRASSKGKTDVSGKAEQTKGRNLNLRRSPSKAPDRKTSKENAPSKTAPESELWNFV